MSKKMSLWGIAVFVSSLVLLVLCSFVQLWLGLWGLVITELVLLVLALGSVKLLKLPFREVFPIKLPSFKELIGVLLLTLGGFILAVCVANITLYFFPEGMLETSQGLSEFLQNPSLMFLIICSCVLPGICEEALHRGVILYTFSGFKSKWLRVLILGVIFGIFHLSPYRFPQTAVLGGLLTYIMLKTDNFLLPVIMHFLNNLISTLVSALSSSTVNTESTVVGLSTVGVSLILCAFALPIVKIGGLLLEKRDESNQRSKITGWVVTGVAAFMLIIAGSVITGMSIVPGEPVINVSGTKEVTQNTVPDEYYIHVPKNGNYAFYFEAESDSTGQTAFVLTDSEGFEVWKVSGEDYNVSKTLRLNKETYILTVSYSYSGSGTVKYGFKLE